MQLWLCRFCGATLDHLTPLGKCPNCGGPGPVKVKEEVPRPSVYQSVKGTVFQSVGYNPLNTLATLLAIALVGLLGVSYAIPATRDGLQGINQVVAVALMGASVLLNRFGLTTLAVIAFMVAFMLN